MSKVGIVTGLLSEARCLTAGGRDGGIVVRAAGADADRAADAARALLDEGCEGLVSFGMAGGLVAELAPGRVVLARRIVGAGAMLPVSLTWRDRLRVLLARDFEPVDADIAGSDSLLDSVAAKEACHAATGAAAVDMESLAVARVAAAAAVPFVAVRAVADPAGLAPPAWAMRTVRPDGGIDVPAALRALVGRPAAWAEAVEMTRDSRAALASLRRVAFRAGALFGLR